MHCKLNTVSVMCLSESKAINPSVALTDVNVHMKAQMVLLAVTVGGVM